MGPRIPGLFIAIAVSFGFLGTGAAHAQRAPDRTVYVKSLESMVAESAVIVRGVIADVALRVRMRVAPLLRGVAEEGDIEQIGLAGIDETGLGPGDSRN